MLEALTLPLSKSAGNQFRVHPTPTTAHGLSITIFKAEMSERLTIPNLSVLE